jgi:predicted nucleotidyltransferase
MLQLTVEEQAWLDAYRDALNKRHPGAVQEMFIYGSKARDHAHAESDLDVLLIVKDDAGALKRDLRRIGYLLAAKTDVLPSIFAYTQEEWESRKRSGSSFRKAVECDAVRVV